MATSIAVRVSPRKGKGTRRPTLDEQLLGRSRQYCDGLEPLATIGISGLGGEENQKDCRGGFRPVMLAHKWCPADTNLEAKKRGTKGVPTDPKGWHMSEKLDGLRAYFDGNGRFYSRNGNPIFAPDWFARMMPKGVPLDGELWCGRGRFQEAVSICKRHKPITEGWKTVKYMCFDAPGVKGGFEKRLKVLQQSMERAYSSDSEAKSHVAMVPSRKCRGIDHLNESMKDVLEKGGEGIMLRRPRSLYEPCRSKALLKVKNFFDEEALVVGSHKGTGKNERVMGALECVLPNGTKFSVGSGFTDKERQNPPRINSVITFKFQETTKDGVPRFPTFQRIRKDVTWEEVKKEYFQKQTDGIDPYKSGDSRKQAKLERRHSVLWAWNMTKDVTGVVTSNNDTKTTSSSKSNRKKRTRDATNETLSTSNASSEEWGCLRCTFLNPGVNRFCGMCRWKRCFKPSIQFQTSTTA